MSYDNDFYYEPSEFEQQIDDFKQTLLNSVRDKFKDEMDQLRKENAELREIKQSMEQIRREHNQKIHELESAKLRAQSIVRQERLSQLLESFCINVYRPESYREELPKCDKCDKYRMVKFPSPSGRMLEEDCSCKYGSKKWHPKEYICVELATGENKMRAWYKPSDYKDSDHMVSADYMERIYDDLPFEEVPKYRAFFRDEEKCRAYCDWLAAQPESL